MLIESAPLGSARVSSYGEAVCERSVLCVQQALLHVMGKSKPSESWQPLPHFACTAESSPRTLWCAALSRKPTIPPCVVFQGFWGSLAERERKASGGVRARLALYGFKLLTSFVLSFGLTLLDNVHLCFSAGTGNNLHIIPGGVRHSNLVFWGFFLVVVGFMLHGRKHFSECLCSTDP